MEGSLGRPTQVHAVPLEERAFDSKGNRLPWGLEWHEDHPNAQGQRRHADEKGPFGKSNKRKASSRTRTATPVKKENPSLEGFDVAYKYDLNREAQINLGSPLTRSQGESNYLSQYGTSANKQPTQVIIYGYSTDTQWAALNFYENASKGTICEDYDRSPPFGCKKYPSITRSKQPKRPLTRAEAAMAFKYDGGEHWVKVTFDTAEAAERALERSPAQVYGHWVHAQPYYGTSPIKDEPILAKEEELDPYSPQAKTRQAMLSRKQYSQTGSSIPDYVPSAPVHETQLLTEREQENNWFTSTAAPDAASTTYELGLRQRRNPSEPSEERGLKEFSQTQMMRHFPEVPRTTLRPSFEAFLPQPTWWERQLQSLTSLGLIPGEVIGNRLPLKDDGKPDFQHASFYWKIFFWLDHIFRTDFCGLKDEASTDN